MIDLKDLRENPDKYRRGAVLKNVNVDVEAILALDEKQRAAQRKFDLKPKGHIELGESLGLVDFQAGVRLAGSRSYFLKGVGAELQAAVLRLATEMMTREKGFTSMSVPVLVREEA